MEGQLRAGLTGFGLLEQVVDQAFAGVLITTAAAEPPGPVIVYANRTLCEITGYGLEDLIGLPPSSLLASADPAEEARRVGRMLAGERLAEEDVGRRKDGSTYPARIRGGLATADEGTPYFAWFLQDASAEVAEKERAQTAEAEIASQHAYYKALIENSLDTIALIGEDGLVKFESPSVVNVLGYRPGELIGESIFGLVHPDDLARVQGAMQEALGGSGAFTERARARHKDGSWRWVEAAIDNRLDDPSISAIVLSLRDVTDRVAIEETLRAAEERFRTLVEQLPAVTYVWEPELPRDGGAPDYTSPQIFDLLGYTNTEWDGEPDFWIHRLHPDDRDRVMTVVAEAERTGQGWKMEHRYLHKDGHEVWVRDEAVILHRPAGRPIAFQGVIYDITERVEADRALRESLERFEALASHAPIGIYQTDAAGQCLYVNATWCEIAGMPLGQALGGGWVEAIHPDDRERVYQEWNGSIRESREFSGEYRFESPDGRIRIVQGNAVPIHDDSGLVTGYIGVIADITARSLAEQELRLARAALQDTTQAAIITELVEGEADPRIVYANPAFSDQTGYSLAEVLGRSTRILHGPATNGATVSKLWEMLNAGLTFEGEMMTYRRDGSSYPRQVAVSPIHDDSGRITHWVSISRDITGEREAEKEVRSSLEALRAAERSNREMLAQLVEAQEQDLSRMAEGVEDRSLQEMTAVRLRLDLLKKSLADPEQIEALDQFGRSVENAVGRLRGLLTELRPRTLDRDGLAAAVREYLKRAAEEGRLESFDVDAGRARELPERQRAAAFRLFQGVVSAAVDRGGRRVAVALEEVAGALSIRIEHDAGPEGGEEAPSGRLALQERAQLAGGWVEPAEDSAEGTVVRFSIPFEVPEPA